MSIYATGTYVVTVKYPKQPGHDPKNKRTGECPVSSACTDVAGEHHSFLVTTDDLDRVLSNYEHVTRVEEVETRLDMAAPVATGTGLAYPGDASEVPFSMPFNPKSTPALWLHYLRSSESHLARLDEMGLLVHQDMTMRDIKIALALVDVARENLERLLRQARDAEGQ